MQPNNLQPGGMIIFCFNQFRRAGWIIRLWHVNNVVYYSYFDTAVNGYLIKAGALDIQKSQ